MKKQNNSLFLRAGRVAHLIVLGGQPAIAACPRPKNWPGAGRDGRPRLQKLANSIRNHQGAGGATTTGDSDGAATGWRARGEVIGW